MIFHPNSDKFISDCIFLSIVRSYHIDALFSEPLIWDFWDFFVDLLAFFGPLRAKVDHIKGSLNFFKVDKRGSFEFFLTLNINEKKWFLRVEEDLFRVTNIAALDSVIIEQHVRDLHQ